MCFVLTLLIVTNPINVHAVGLGNTSGGDVNDPPSGGGGGAGKPNTVTIRTNISGTYSGSDGGGTFDGTVAWPYYAITPKVTATYSLNALLRDNHGAVVDGKTVDSPGYYVPTLDQLPINLETALAYKESNDGTAHKFAVVYTGYYDSNVLLNKEIIDSEKNVDNVGKYTTSTGEAAIRQTSRALMLMGADLQLQSETCDIYQKKKGVVQADYTYQLATGSTLRTDTAVMDIYKALKQYQYEYKFAWVIDDSISLATSPIQEKINTLLLASSANPKGIDTSEGKTWVWVTRTNPDLYWDQCVKDNIFGGGAQNTSSPSCTAYAVPFAKSRTDSLTVGEFCVLARSMMYLYGEPEMSEQEQLLALHTYNMQIPTNINDTVKDSVTYLTAKGIIDPTMYTFSDTCTYELVEEILMRIRDTDSRLVFDAGTYNTDNDLYKKGYSSVEMTPTEDIIDSIEIAANSAVVGKFDYFIEKGTDTLFYNDEDAIVASDFTVYANGTQVGLSEQPTGFEYYGLSELGYYHFKIPVKYSDGNIEIKSMSGTKHDENGNATGSTSFTIPAGGGVYSYTEHITNPNDVVTETDSMGNTVSYSRAGLGKGALVRASFVADDSISYPKAYVDKERKAASEGTSGVVLLADDNATGVVLTLNKTQLLNNCDKMIWVFEDGTSTALGDMKKIDEYGTSLREILSADANSKLQYQVLGEVQQSGANATDANVTYVQIFFPGWTNTDDFLKHLDYKSAKVSLGAYYSSAQNTALVDFNYFVENKMAYGMVKCGASNQNRMFVTASGVNVFLNNEQHLITVGNTVFRVPENEDLYYETGDTTYINAKAAFGWASRTTIMKLASGNITVLSNDAVGSFGSTTLNKTVTLPYSSSTTSIAWINNAPVAGMSSKVSGVLLTGNYTLSNYLCYIDTAGGNNRIYFLTHKKVVPYESSDLQLRATINTVNRDEVTTKAKEQFKTDMGIDFPDYPDYTLSYITVRNPDISLNIKGDASAAMHVYFCQTLSTDLVDNKVRSDIGYVYQVPTTSMKDYKTYVNGYLKRDVDKLFPLVQIGGKLYDINYNMFKASASDEYPQMYGVLPKFVYAHTRDTKSYFKFNGGTLVDYSEKSKDSLLKTGTLMPAPAGMFNFIQGVQDTKASALSEEDTLYYGTQQCTVKSTGIILNGFEVQTNESDSTLSTIIRRANNTAVYRVGASYTSSPSLLDWAEETSEQLVASVSDPDALVDWTKYSFDRLVENVDNWSTILLIFVLNVLPRIGLFLFMIILILSTIRDVKPWKMFCERVFDIYSILTFGKQNVNTINTGRLFFQSIIAMALFGMLMDGVFYMAVMWIAEFIVRIANR